MLRNSKRREDKMGKRNQFPQLDSVNRIRNIPIVETGWLYASDLYQKVKKSNSLVSWGLGTAESSVQATLELTLPMVSVFEGPISLVDTLLCKSLDIVEQRLPAVKLPPDQLLENTKEYMNTTVLQPVLRRANSVKQFGLDQAVSAADRLESALDVADKYVDEYLPDIAGGPPEENKETNNLSGNNNKALKTIHRVDRFSRKLQRRLTQHTLAEAKAFKHYGKDALQFVMYSAELMAKDPRTAMAKLADLWENLSQDEPENQARPANLEQLTLMVTRELARRVVHMVNHSREGIAALPELLQFAAQYCSALADHIIKSMHIDGAKDAAIAHARAQFAKLELMLKDITTYANLLLVRAEKRNDCSTSQWTTSQQQVQRYYGLKKQPSLFCKQPECSGLKRQTCLRLSYELSIIYSHNKYTFKYLSHLIAYSC